MIRQHSSRNTRWRSVNTAGQVTSYFYTNYRFSCKINLGYNSVLPALIGYTIENAECCPLSYPFVCQTYVKPYNQVRPPDRWAGW